MLEYCKCCRTCSKTIHRYIHCTHVVHVYMCIIYNLFMYKWTSLRSWHAPIINLAAPHRRFAESSVAVLGLPQHIEVHWSAVSLHQHGSTLFCRLVILYYITNMSLYRLYLYVTILDWAHCSTKADANARYRAGLTACTDSGVEKLGNADDRSDW